MARQVLENGVVLPAEYSDDWYDDMTSNLTKLDDVIGSDSEKLSSADVGAAALSNSYNDLDNLPTIPTKTSDLTNDSNFVDTSNSAVASGITSAKVTDYDSHIADTDIHVTTADKSKWNNGVSQSYVFRYSSASVTDNSTIAYSTLDNTDNIKASDKVIDVDGKIFSIVSVDTANSTFTVGSALVGLALDANVVHTSGNETISGAKTFSDNLLIYNSDNSVDAPRLNIKTSKYVKGDTTNTDTMRINFLDANGNSVASVYANKNTSGTQYLSFHVYTTDNNNANITSTINYYISKNGDKYFLPYEDNQISLGGTVRRWKSVYATNYYYGSDNVEFSTKFVTSDTAQTVSGVKTFSSSPLIYNSDTTASIPQITLKNQKVVKSSTTETGAQLIYFADKNNQGLGQIDVRVVSNGTTGLNLTSFGLDSNNQNISSGVQILRSPTTANFAPNADNAVTCGRSLAKWSDVQTYKINALEPSSLSLPSDNINDIIDISSYFSVLDGSNANTYVAPANGWISITMSSCSGIQAYITGLWGHQIVRPTVGGVRFFMPVLKNKTVNILIFGGTIDNARFIPCQGNV